MLGLYVSIASRTLRRNPLHMGVHIIVWALLVAGCAPSPTTEDRRPNVILVMTDDQGYGDIGAHGNPTVQTPHLDMLHAESIRFTDFHVDPTCSPTRAALLTGRYSTKTGVWHTIAGRSQLSRDETTMAEVLSQAGYATGIFGKWHLGDNDPFRPQDRGFDDVLIHGGGGIGQTPDAWGNDYFDDTYWHNGQAEAFEGYCTTVFFDRALSFIQAHRSEPFFLYLPTNVAHSPFRAPDSYVQPYRDAGVSDRLARFYGMITHFDDQLGRLRRQLSAWDLAENTIFIFMTDNGTAGRDHNAGMRGYKGSAFDGGHRVPFYLYWPAGGLAGGRDVDTLTAHIDVLPTLMELADVPLPAGLDLDGRSLVPLLEQTDSWPDRTLFVHSQRVQHPEKWRQSAVMTERWRLINGEALYDIRADSAQETDVASEHPAVVSELRAAYDAWWDELADAFDEYTRIVLGRTVDTPSRLTAHDWHNPTSDVPWHQDHIEEDPVLNGYWTVDVAHGGTYEIALRQRPRGVRYGIDGVEARVSIGGVERSVAIPEGVDEVRARVDVAAGPTRLQTWLVEADGTTRGAYYVYVTRTE